jgi:hypothetical protein
VYEYPLVSYFFWDFFIQTPQRRLVHELEERRALGLVRVRPPASGTREALVPKPPVGNQMVLAAFSGAAILPGPSKTYRGGR